MDQHPSPIARISRELGDSGTKEILPPTERNLTMLSEGNRKLALSMKTGFTTADGYGWWSFHDITLNRLLDAARAEGATSLEAELKRLREAARCVLDEAPLLVVKAIRQPHEAAGLETWTAAVVALRAALQPKEPDNAQ